jgi:hypothetical protein
MNVSAKQAICLPSCLQSLWQTIHQTRLDLWLEKYVLHHFIALSALYFQKSDFWLKTNTSF